jgi:ankyrin repeat protein
VDRLTFEALDANHRTLLNWACWHDYDAMAIQLVNVCQPNVDTVDCEGKTPLHHANTLQLIKCLVESGRANVHAVDNNGDTVLHLCFESLDTLDYLLEQPGANVDVANKDGETVLHLASKRGFYAYLAQYLIENVDAGVHVQDKKGWTALHHAASVRFLGAALVLLKAGARVETIDAVGRTALHLACTSTTGSSWRDSYNWRLVYVLLGHYYTNDDAEDVDFALA